MSAAVPAARAKIAELIERRARELAAGAENTGSLLPKDVSWGPWTTTTGRCTRMTAS